MEGSEGAGVGVAVAVSAVSLVRGVRSHGGGGVHGARRTGWPASRRRAAVQERVATGEAPACEGVSRLFSGWLRGRPGWYS